MHVINKFKHKGKIYRMILFFTTGAIALSIAIISIVLLLSFNGIVRNEIISTNTLTNQYVSNQAVNMSDGALKLSNAIYNDYTVRKLMNNGDPDIYELNQAFIQLKNYRLTNNTIQSIYVYNAATDTLYVEAGTSNISSVINNYKSMHQNFVDTYAWDYIENFKEHVPYMPIPRKIKESDAGIDYCYTFLMYDIYSKSNKNSIIMVNFTYDGIINTGNNSQSGKLDDVFAVNSNGILISKCKGQNMLDDLSKNMYIQKALQSQESDGSFESRIGNNHYLIIYNKNNPYGWTFISKIPYTSLSNKIRQMKLMTILLDLVIFGLLIIISYLISNQIYRPIYNIITELKSNRSRIRTDKIALRQMFLKDVILGKTINTKEYLMPNCKKYEINLDYDEKVCLVLFHIDEFVTFNMENNILEQSSLKYAIINVAQEILASDFQADGAEIENDLIAVIVNVSCNYSGNIKSIMEEPVKKIQFHIRNSLNITLSAAVSAMPLPMSEISSLYKETSNALRHGFFRGYGCTIFTDEIQEKSITDYNYPLRHEKQLIDYLTAMSVENAKQEYNQITGELELYPMSCTEMAISRLAFAINNLLKVKKADYAIQLPENMDTLDRVNKFFYCEFENICDRINTEKNTKYVNVIAKIDQLINSEYSDPALSIDYISERIGLSVSHISRLYKQITNRTILDRILNVRISKSKELLTKTKISVCEISAETGFSSASYFNKVFKKATGMTPNNYRQSEKRNLL